ncbi:hypothetical protein D3C85_1103540 [compost metagenome]
MAHVFITSCVNAHNGEDINEMVDTPQKTEMSNAYFIEKLAPKLGIDQQVLSMLGYDTKKFFTNDFALNCARSHYQGVPCVYVQHSRIEYIFVDQKDVHKMLSKSEAKARQISLSVLSDDLNEMIEERSPKSAKDYYSLAEAFHKEHKNDLEASRIPMSSLAQHGCDYREPFALFDKRNYGPNAALAREGSLSR